MADRAQVIAYLYPKIQAALAGTGIDPRLAMAQFLQETGGNLDRPGFGIFNITAGGGWNGPSITRGDATAGDPGRQQRFRAYGSIDEAVADYAKLLTTSPRYAGLRGGTLEQQAAALGASGYAEDKTYGEKVLKIAQGLPQGTGAAYATGPAPAANANGIPGGVRPEDLQWGGGYTPAPQGVVSAQGTAPAPTTGERARDIHELEAILKKEFPELRVTSGYRSPEYNRSVGGAQNSQHMHGTAMDIGLKELPEATRKAIIDRAVQLGARGIGYYPNSQSAHIDMRSGAPAAWGGNKSRTSLGETPPWFQDAAKRVFAQTGSTGAAYPSQPGTPAANANGIPGGIRPSDLPWGGGYQPVPPGVLAPAGTAPAPATNSPSLPAAPAPNSDAARMLSDPSRYGVSPEQVAALRAAAQRGVPLGNVTPPVSQSGGRSVTPTNAPSADASFFEKLFAPQPAPPAPKPPGVVAPTGTAPPPTNAPATIGTAIAGADTGGFQQRPAREPTPQEREETRKYLEPLGPGPIGIWNPAKIWSQRPEYARPQPDAGVELQRFAEQHPDIRAWQGQNQAPVIGEPYDPNKKPLGLLGGW